LPAPTTVTFMIEFFLGDNTQERSVEFDSLLRRLDIGFQGHSESSFV
jgi:hypothetical protein